MMRNPNRHACRGWRDVTRGERESRVSNAADLTAIADRLAIIDLVNRHVDDIDAKRWDNVGDFFSEDAVAQWTPEKSMQGPAGIVGAMRQMLDTDEVVTYHDVGNFSPVISGNTAEADIRIRAMHNGAGPRAGRFYESLGIQKTRFARTADGWRCNYYEWQIVVKLGSMDVFASEVASPA
jgi:hypothetical protein